MPQIPFWLLGVAILMVGAVPPLLANAGVSPAETAAADKIYVSQRIAHHLNFGNFAISHVARFAVMVAGWLILFQFSLRHGGERTARRTLFHFGIGSLLISLAGLCLSAGLESQSGKTVDAELDRVFSVAGLLKYYWFRLSDFAIPATLALGIGWGLGKLLGTHNSFSRKLSASMMIVLIMVATTLMIVDRYRDPRPMGDRRGLPSYPDDAKRTQQTYENWIRVNDWIRINTPPDARFFTPQEQQTFKWYAARSEVVNWKDVPQDAPALLAWNQRVDQLLWPQKRFESGLMVYSDAQLRALGKQYNADYLLMPQWQVELATERTGLKQVYPETPHDRATYVIFAIK